MNKKWYYNNYVFRLISPLVLGVLVYMLVLLFFDSVDEILTNFFSREVLFVVFLSIFFLEINRLIIIIFNKTLALEFKIQLRILFQFIISIVLSTGIISLFLYLYFIHYEGFSTITTELITFNLIYFFVAILYQLYYFSIVFLYKRNDSQIRQEAELKKNTEMEMESFKNHVNPDFLFQSLEIIISQLHANKKKADELINKLATVYRFTLDNQHCDLVPIKNEVDMLRPILTIFKAKYNDALNFTFNINNNASGYVIPRTLQILFEHAIFQNIITTALPLNFTVSIVDENLIVTYTLNKKLKTNGSASIRFSKLQSAYIYYSKKGITANTQDGIVKLSIPLLSLDDE